MINNPSVLNANPIAAFLLKPSLSSHKSKWIFSYKWGVNNNFLIEIFVLSGGNAYLCPKKAAMNYLEEKIMRDGVILPGNVLKVDSFLNHQVDIDAMRFMAQELQRRFEGVKITKILTIEASGIAIATMLAHYLHVPFVFAKKCLTINSIDDKYVSHAFSFTENRRHSVYVSKPYLSPADHVLIVDDFWQRVKQPTPWLTSYARQEQHWQASA